jgi:hypothetical protein
MIRYSSGLMWFGIAIMAAHRVVVVFGVGDRVEFGSIGLEVAIGDLYGGVSVL